eukprot:gene54367-15350_t
MCGDHATYGYGDGYEWCYVADPDPCGDATESVYEGYRGLYWSRDPCTATTTPSVPPPTTPQRAAAPPAAPEDVTDAAPTIMAGAAQRPRTWCYVADPDPCGDATESTAPIYRGLYWSRDPCTATTTPSVPPPATPQRAAAPPAAPEDVTDAAPTIMAGAAQRPRT